MPVKVAFFSFQLKKKDDDYFLFVANLLCGGFFSVLFRISFEKKNDDDYVPLEREISLFLGFLVIHGCLMAYPRFNGRPDVPVADE